MKNPSQKIKIFIYITIWIILISELIFDPELKTLLQQYLIKHPLLAPLLLVCLQLIFTIFILPCSTLTILAGVLWGAELGILYSTLATLTASSLTFYLGRYSSLNTKIKQNYAHSQWTQKVNQLLTKFNLWASALAHVNPIFPGSSLGYLFGVTNMKYWKFILGAAIGTMPLQIIMVSIGNASINALFSDTYVQSILTIGILAALLALYIFVTPKLLSNKSISKDDGSSH
jgi:uncharacterized membrane protein YdjX (TVP38/TMEM64 family)